MNRILPIILLVLLATGLGIFLIIDDWADVAPTDAPQSVKAAAAETPLPQVSSTQAESVETEDSQSCLTEAQMESHPSLLTEVEFMNEVQVLSEHMQRYRGLDENDLESLAEQGDSGAMATLGARYALAANGLDPDRASDYFDPRSRDPEISALRSPMLIDYSDEQIAMLETAMDWYFQSAVHGRYMALQEIGVISTRLVGTAVQQGWVTEDEYQTLSSGERGALLPANVYAEAGRMLMPDTGDSPLLELMFTLGPKSSRQFELAAGIAASVSSTQARLRVSPQHVDVSEVLSGQELLELLCDDEKARILKEVG